MAAEHSFLVVERKDLPFRHMPDGGLTLDPDGFSAHAGAERLRKEAEGTFNRHQQDAARKHPERVALIWKAWQTRLISTVQAAELVSGGLVTDDGFDWLEGVAKRGVPIPEDPEFSHVRCWIAEIHSGEATRQPAFDPVPEPDVPVASLVRVLDDMCADGWEVLHVSEDCAVSADEVSFVVAARYLLRRQIDAIDLD